MKRIAVALLLAGLALVPRAAGAATGSARVNPHGHLVDGQVVTVTWRGFHKDSRIWPGIEIAQCSRMLDLSKVIGTQVGVATIQQYCDDATTSYLIAANHGTAPFTVTAGQVDEQGHTCGTSADNADGCELVVYQADQVNIAVRAAVAIPIRFVTPE